MMLVSSLPRQQYGFNTFLEFQIILFDFLLCPSELSCCSIERAGRWYGMSGRRHRDVSTSSVGKASSPAEDTSTEAASSAEAPTMTLRDMCNGFDLMTLDPIDKKASFSACWEVFFLSACFLFVVCMCVYCHFPTWCLEIV